MRGVVRLVDVAGIGDPGDVAHSPAERDVDKQMRQTAHRALEQADVLVLVRDATDDRPEAALPRPPDVRVASKADLLEQMPARSETIPISAVTGLGMDSLREALDRAAFGSDAPGASLVLTSRHLQCLADAMAELARRGMWEKSRSYWRRNYAGPWMRWGKSWDWSRRTIFWGKSFRDSVLGNKKRTGSFVTCHLQ